MNLHTIRGGRNDDCLIDERAERERLRSLTLIANWKSLAATQKRLAPGYRKWAAQGGPDAERCAKEAQRLEDESRKYSARAAKEQEELNG